MDVHSGISTTSDSQNANFAACANSCSFSFQGFEEFSKLCRATENNIMKHTGLVVHIGDVVGLLTEYVLRRFPPALVKLSSAASASLLGDVAVGRAFPSGPSLGSPSVGHIVPLGLPHGSPACDVAARTGLPVRTPRTSSPSACSAALPGLPNGSPAGVSAARPASPACSAAPPGLPRGSPAGAPAAWPGSPYCAPVGLAPAAPRSVFGPGPVVGGAGGGSPVGVSAAWPVSPACSAAPPGLPQGSPAGAPAAWPGLPYCAPVGLGPAAPRSIFGLGPVVGGAGGEASLGSVHLSQLTQLSMRGQNVLAEGAVETAAWPRLHASFFEPRYYSVPSVTLPPTLASVIPVDFGGVGSSPVSPALSASSADSVDTDGSSPRSRRRRRRARSPRGDALHPATSSSSSCASQGGGVQE